jgi:Ni,Fe-hydrogenase III small subunit
MLKMLRKIHEIGLISEAAPPPEELLRVRGALDERIRVTLGRALCIRHVDAGSCNGCELEIQALNNPIYNLEGLGIRFVASPRHADLLLVTGPVAANMVAALQAVYAATPDPKLVVATGDCACTGGILSPPPTACATGPFPRGRVSNVIPVDVAVPGCPPTPARIMQGILTAIDSGVSSRRLRR